jgi:hypothetical protein
MKELCVVHLVRAHNGIEPFRRFLESYKTNSGGIEHDLLIVFKGFDHHQDTTKYLELLTPFIYEALNVPDEGFDIAAYFVVVKRYSDQYRYFCFLNSFSVIQDREWLMKLYENILQPDAGLVGATGCWNSNKNNARAWFRGLPAEIYRKREIKNWETLEVLTPEESYLYTVKAYWKAAFFLSRQIWRHLYSLIYFDSFPNYHVRTNTFMILGELMNSLEYPIIKSKMDAYKFESGRKSLTLQIIKKGKKTLIVGKDGIGYDKEIWHKSRTFWSFDQENLLVADNQTIKYQNGTKEKRQYLSLIAWGKVY